MTRLLACSLVRPLLRSTPCVPSSSGPSQLVVERRVGQDSLFLMMLARQCVYNCILFFVPRRQHRGASSSFATQARAYESIRELLFASTAIKWRVSANEWAIIACLPLLPIRVKPSLRAHRSTMSVSVSTNPKILRIFQCGSKMLLRILYPVLHRHQRWDVDSVSYPQVLTRLHPCPISAKPIIFASLYRGGDPPAVGHSYRNSSPARATRGKNRGN